jgi:hypothetical protein
MEECGSSTETTAGNRRGEPCASQTRTATADGWRADEEEYRRIVGSTGKPCRCSLVPSAPRKRCIQLLPDDVSTPHLKNIEKLN